MSPDEKYVPLLSDEEGHLDIPKIKQTRRCNDNLYWVIIGAQSVALIIFAFAFWIQPSRLKLSQVLYSPAQDALEYIPVRFSGGIGRQATKYQGKPSETVDKAWDDLYNGFGLSKIPKSQAVRLPNETLPIPGDESNYVVALSVFHQLHCLNTIRRSLYPDYYADSVTGAIAGIPPEDLPEHIDHCIDNIRQALMCGADISLIVWQWSSVENAAFPKTDTMHSCRNYEKVVEWAKDHKLEGFNRTIHAHPIPSD